MEHFLTRHLNKSNLKINKIKSYTRCVEICGSDLAVKHTAVVLKLP